MKKIRKKYLRAFMGITLSAILAFGDGSLAFAASENETREIVEEPEAANQENIKEEPETVGQINPGENLEEQTETIKQDSSKENLKTNLDEQPKIAAPTDLGENSAEQIDADKSAISEAQPKTQDLEKPNEQNISQEEQEAKEAVGTEQNLDFYTYRVNDDSLTAEITGYDDSSSIEEPVYIQVPDTLGKYKVTAVAENAFFNLRREIKKITLPESIESINSNAFGANVVSVSINNSHYKSEDSDMAVYSTDGTELVFFSARCAGTFTFKKELRKFPNFFLSTSGVRTLVFEEGVTRLPDGTGGYMDCTNVENIVFPSTLAANQTYSSYNDKAGTDLNDASPYFNLFVFGASAASEHNNQIYEFSGESPYYVIEDGVIYSKDKKRLVAYSPGRKDAVYKVPNSVEWIMAGAFAGNTHLKEIQLPESVIRIDSQAFCGTINLEKLNIPKSVRICSAISGVFDYCAANVSINYNNIFAKWLRKYEHDQKENLFDGKLIYTDVHEIRYVPNKGKLKNPKDKNITAVEGEFYSFPKVSRTGYILKGWYTKETGGRKIGASEKVSATSPKTLYAQWQKGYTITYKLNGGKNNGKNPKTYTITSKTITLKKPTRKGFTFKGWYKDSAKKKKVTSIPKGSKGNKTFYAKWTANQYKIAFNGNGGTGSMKKISCQYSKTYKLLANKYKRKGYTFAGWNVKKNGTGKAYKNKEKVKGLRAKNGATIVLYAQWKKKK